MPRLKYVKQNAQSRPFQNALCVIKQHFFKGFQGCLKECRQAYINSKHFGMFTKMPTQKERQMETDDEEKSGESVGP